MKVHITTVIFFLAFGGLLAGLNHTRFDIVISLFGYKLYDSKAHDVHHCIPQSNYGQYMMLWDYIFGSYRCVVLEGAVQEDWYCSLQYAHYAFHLCVFQTVQSRRPRESKSTTRSNDGQVYSVHGGQEAGFQAREGSVIVFRM